MAYVYRHIREDKKEVFYIGIGSDDKGKYTRAFCKQRLNNRYWSNITKSIPYRVEILIDNLSWEQACIKEIEFILLYGRIDLGKGTLVNLTDGGDGNTGKIISQHVRLLSSNRHSRPIVEYSKQGVIIKEYKSATHAAKEKNIAKSAICKNANGGLHHTGGSVFIWKNQVGTANHRFNVLSHNDKIKKPISVYNLSGDFISKYSSITEASKTLNIPANQICAVVLGRKKKYYGFHFFDYPGHDGDLDITHLRRVGRSKKVNQYNINGNFIKTHFNQRDAASFVRISEMCISDCLNGKQKTAGGYKWEYV